MSTSRERTYQWQDPLEGAVTAQSMSGLEYLRAMQEGKLPLPPVLHTLDIYVKDIREGNVAFEFLPKEFHYNPIGAVHGGVISTLLDSAMGCSVHSTLKAGIGYTTIEMKVNFVKGVTVKQGKLMAVGKVIFTGARTSLAEAQLIDDNGVLYAHATSTCLLIEFKKQA
ncbi:MAG TPA: PaaI family thioesterase [Ohtaekwangia sp.]|uniref:PaaI family thioesterase n=1 Tax=Ohtaekwangia sp. TaxID=2066019 RepID=UPI002F94B1C6